MIHKHTMIRKHAMMKYRLLLYSFRRTNCPGSAGKLALHNNSGGKTHKIEALVLRRIMSNIASCSVAFNQDWKHVSNSTLGYPEFGVPGSVDNLLGADVFSRAVLHGRQFGPLGSPSAIKTTFGWVLAGSVRAAGIQSQQHFNCCLVISSPDDFLR